AAARAEAWRTAGELRLVRADTAGAADAFRRTIQAAPGTAAALAAARQLTTLPGLTVEDHLRIGRLYLRHGNLDRGIAGLSAYLDAGAGTAAERTRIRLDLAQALFNAGRYDDAVPRLLRLVEDSPSERIAGDALYLAARAQYRQGEVERAKATLRRVADRFPRQDAGTKAMYLFADLEHDAGNLPLARQFYRRAVDAGSDIEEAGLALMRLAGMALVDGDYRAALDIFEAYRARYPNGRRYQQATYWAARAFHELGNEEQMGQRLRETWRHDPLSFYGVLAGEQLGLSPVDTHLEPSPQPPPSVQADVARALLRLDLLRELGDNGAAELEVGRIDEHFSDADGAIYLVAEALNERGFTFSGIGLGWDIQRREGAWNPRLLRIIYPLPFREFIVAESQERGLDPWLVAGLIRQESMFSAAVTSPAGAIGLMQIMPNTGRALARGAALEPFEISMLEQPEVNIHLGTRYFAELLGRYDGRITAVLAAYNAGPHRVAAWRKFPEWRDEELFGERIPFAETRDYVRKVRGNAAIYRALYGADGTGPDNR
ncbi:MAG: transglycosylase SLT domain-containing protein, partial [Longimicrobiales bacterium]